LLLLIVVAGFVHARAPYLSSSRHIFRARCIYLAFERAISFEFPPYLCIPAISFVPYLSSAPYLPTSTLLPAISHFAVDGCGRRASATVFIDVQHAP
jgi:hypothetical protein